MSDVQLRWYTIPTEPEPELVNIFIGLRVGQIANSISFSIPVLARAQLDVEMLVIMGRSIRGYH